MAPELEVLIPLNITKGIQIYLARRYQNSQIHFNKYEYVKRFHFPVMLAAPFPLMRHSNYILFLSVEFT